MGWFFKDNLKEIRERIEKKSKLGRYIQFCIGCLCIAISFNLFLAPNDIVSGGVSGISILLNHLIGINTSVFILSANVLLLVLSYFLLGKEKTRASVFGSLLYPFFIEITKNINLYLEIDNSQLLLSTVFAGILYGFGSGIIFKAGFTTGGTDILNQIISKYFKVGMGKSILYCDGTIVACTGLIFGINKLMYSILVLYLVSYMSDKVILGISDSKAFYIITKEEKKIREYILKYLNHGVTVIDAKGGFHKENKNVLLCVLPTKDYYKLKEGINEIDKDAFFVVTDAYEVSGGE